MIEYKVKQGQNIIDVCIQVYGNLNSLGKMLHDNDLTLTSDLVGNQIIKYDESVGSLPIRSYLIKNKINILN